MNLAYILAFLFSLVISVAAMPFVIRLTERFGIIAKPDPRKVHQRYTPSAGGIGIYIGFACSLALLYLFDVAHFRLLLSYPLMSYKVINPPPTIQTYLSGILIGGAIIVGLGIIDDKKGVTALTKLLAQIIAAMVVLQYGIKIMGITNPFSGKYVSFPIIVTTMVTAFWIIGFINSVNLVDGIDGLAAGIVAIASITFAVITVYQIGIQSNTTITKGLKLVAILAAALAGSCMGFLRYNFYPAKIFMGDTGAMFLGFSLGCITIIGILKTAAAIALFIPIIIFGIPILDTLFAIIRRLLSRQPLMQADKGHFHHYLLAMGWNQRRTVIFMYIVSALLGVLAIILNMKQ